MSTATPTATPTATGVLAPTSTATATLTVSVSTFSRRGTYNMTIKGTSGSLSHTRVVTLVVQ